MGDLTKGPDTRLSERATTPQGPSADLSALNLSAEAITGPTLEPFRHTPQSVQQKWGTREFDTGVTITGSLKGGRS